jgi:hypothetical protein
MTEFAITSDQLMWLCTLIAGLWSVVKIIKEIRKPNDDLKKTVDRHSELLDNDNKRLNEHEESNHMILKCLLVIINHEITGNGIETMKEARDDLQKYLVDK